MIKILPMAKPLLDGYPLYGAIFSILGAHTQDYLPWVYNTFIQLFAPSNLKDRNRLNYAIPDPFRDCPWIECFALDRHLALDMTNIIDLTKHYINHNYYLYWHLSLCNRIPKYNWHPK